ncbi:hypothetical protein AB0I28_15140 [Phytomonospora sp. NPDC050363]|uniref:hypothetical protein n=1 Tax=Phytomonospora sp. NPDC050363 TaxID=3155642 RepID=UPI0033CCB4E4
MTYRTATDAESRRRSLDGGPSPFRAPEASMVEEPLYDPFSPADEETPTESTEVHHGQPEDTLGDLDDEAPDEPVDPRLGSSAFALSAHRRLAQSRANVRSWMRILATVIGIALLAGCAAGTFVLLREDAVNEPGTAGATAPPAGGEEQAADPLDARATDPAPVTVTELFAQTGVIAASGTYETVKAEALANCAAAATGKLAELLDRHECSQVVRATLLSPDGSFALTAGVVNLVDAESAQAVRTGVEEDAGDFTILHGGGDTAVLGRTATVLGYNTYGHFLLYVVIAPTDGSRPDQGDPVYAAIVGEIVETHLAQALRPRQG